MAKIDRRFLLRGSCQGALAVVALPFLDCFLDSKGKALAATGAAVPTRFSTFFWGCGLTNALWTPTKAGTDYEMTTQLKPLEAFRKKMNVFSGLRLPLDDKANFQHWSGLGCVSTGIAPTKTLEFDSKTIDQQVADVIAKGVRFKTVTAAANGNPKDSYSSLGGANKVPADPTALALYTRLFGPGFQDPAKGDWKPDPRVMVQQSVLSIVSEDRKSVMQGLGAADKARMDQFFTSLREGEQQLAAELKRPEIVAKVTIPGAPEVPSTTNAMSDLRKNVPLMAKLGAIAFATDQTRVFNLAVSEPHSLTFRLGDPQGFHTSTHEEPIDPNLNYQVRVAQYNLETMELMAAFLQEMDAIPEGDGTVLDHSLVMALTDQSYARIHSIDGLPVMTFGGASGRMKTGYHIAGGGNAVSRVGLTVQRAMGIPLESWGAGSLQVKTPFTELLA